MDDRTWYLAVGALALAGIGLVLDVAVGTFDVPGGLWGFLSALLGFLGARAAVQMRQKEQQNSE